MVLNVMCYFFLRHGVLGQRLNDTALRGETHLRATGHHLSHEITRVTCHLTQLNVPHLIPVRKANTRFTYPGGAEG